MRGIRNHDPAAEDPYVSVAEAARTLKISRPTVHARVAAGKLEQTTVAGRPVITRESLQRLVDDQAEKLAGAA